MKKFIVGLAILAALSTQGCANSNFMTDTNIDPVEAATIQLSVGAAMAAYPKTVVPAFQVSSALLAVKNSDTNLVALSFLDDELAKETAKLNLDPLTLQSFNDLILLVRVSINNKLSDSNIPENEKLVMVWKVVEIVNATAKARIDLVK